MIDLANTALSDTFFDFASHREKRIFSERMAVY
jgi:hypothetical protein